MLFKLFKTSDFIEYEEIFKTGNSIPESFYSNEKILYFGTLSNLIFNDISLYASKYFDNMVIDDYNMLTHMNHSDIFSTLDNSLCLPSKIHYPNFSKDLKKRLNLLDEFFSIYSDSYISGLKSIYSISGQTIKDFFEPRFLNRAYVIHFFRERTDETPFCVATFNVSFEAIHHTLSHSGLSLKIGDFFKSHGFQENLFEEDMYVDNDFRTDFNFYSESGSIIYPNLFETEASLYHSYKKNSSKRENEYELSESDFEDVSQMLFYLCSDSDAHDLSNNFHSFSLFNIYKDEASLRKQELYGYFEGMLPICPIE